MRTDKRSLIIVTLLGLGFATILAGILGEEQWGWGTTWASLVKEGGLLLAAVLTGHVIHDGIIRSDERREMKDLIESSLVAMHKGLKLVARGRQGYDGYYHWILRTDPEVVCIGGRSCLHRIDADARVRKMQGCAQQFYRRLRDGCKIYVAFLDPQMPFIPTLALEEGRTSNQMLKDLAQSLGICLRLYEMIKRDDEALPANAGIEVRLSKSMPYQAFQGNRESAIVGFYFPDVMGLQTGAWQCTDRESTEIFYEGFQTYFRKSPLLMERRPSTGDVVFNHDLYGQIRVFLEDKIGAEELGRLMPQASISMGEPVSNPKSELERFAAVL